MTLPRAMQAVRIENPGPDAKLVLVELPLPQPKPDEILLKIEAAGVNRADLLQAQGRYPPPKGAPETPGMEAAGTIAALGANIRARKTGDRACALLAGGGYAQYCVAHEGSVLPIPERMDMIHAAALPEACFTAWTNIMDSGRLAPGETLLVHGGASGIGTIAIQIFAARGHRVFTTAGTRDKCALAMKLGAAHAINYREEDFAEIVKRETGGNGVDVILDMVGGDYVQRNLNALARKGRLVNIAYQKGARVELDLSPVMLKRLVITGSTLRARSNEQKAAIAAEVKREVWPLVESGKIHPIVDSAYPLADAGKAHARMASGAHAGKIVLTA